MMTIRSIINFGEVMPLTAGISVRIDEGAQVDISCAILKEEKNLVTTVKIMAGLKSIEELEQALTSLLPAATRIHLNLEGKGILTKIFNDDDKALDHPALVRKHFPMVNPAEFICQVCYGAGQNFITILRHEALQPFARLTERFSVVSVTQGAFIASAVLPFLEATRLLIKGYDIQVHHKQIAGISSSAEGEALAPFIINGETVVPEGVLAYASAWSILLPNAALHVSEVPWADASRVRYGLAKRLYQSSRIALVAILLGLLVNTGIYFWLQSAVDELEAKQLVVVGQNEESVRKRTQRTALRGAYEKIGWEDNTQPIYYADQIGSVIDARVQLLELEVGVPDNEMLKKEKRYVYQPGLLRIKGAADDPVALHELIRTLEKFSWVKGISDQHYHLDNKVNKGIFEFYIQVR